MKKQFHQIKLSAPNDRDSHPRLLLDGDGIHAGCCFTALFPNDWHDITLEVAWDITGPACWYISTPGFAGVSPIGLFVQL